MVSPFVSLGPRLAGFGTMLVGGGQHQPLGKHTPLVVIGIFLLIVAAIASIGGDYSLNDDYAYGVAVRAFLEKGELYLPTACAAGFAHVFWGCLFAKVLGISYVSLRWSSVVAAGIGAFLAYCTFLEMGLHRRESLYCALLYAGNPIMINLYLCYMSDVPTLALEAGFFLLLFKALKRASLRHLLWSLLLLLLAISIRQSCVVLALAAPAIFLARFGPVWRRLLLTAGFIGSAVLVYWAVDAWLMWRDAHGVSIVDHYAAARLSHKVFVVGFFQTPVEQITKSIAALGAVSCYMGLFSLPLLLPSWLWWLCRMLSSRLKNSINNSELNDSDPNNLGSGDNGAGDRRASIGRFLLPGMAAALAICLLSAFYETTVRHALMPFCENIWRVTNVGALGMMGIANPLLTPRQKVRLTVVSYILAGLFLTQLLALLCLCTARLLRALRRNGGKKLSAPANIAVPVCLAVVIAAMSATLAFLTVETVVRCVDRYYLIALLPAIMTAAWFARIYRLRYTGAIGIALLIAFVTYSLAGGQDYLNGNAARWRALTKLEAQGIASNVIDGGAEYNITRDINVYASHYRGEPPRDNWRWWPIHGEQFIVSFSPVPDYEEKWHETYFSALTLSEHPVYVLEKMKLNK